MREGVMSRTAIKAKQPSVHCIHVQRASGQTLFTHPVIIRVYVTGKIN